MQVRPPEHAKDVPFAGSRAREKTCKIDALHISSIRTAAPMMPCRARRLATKGIVSGVAGAEVSSGNARVWRDAPRCRRDHVRLRGRQSRLIQSGIAYARRLTGKAASAAWSGAVQLSPRPRCGRSGVSRGINGATPSDPYLRVVANPHVRNPGQKSDVQLRAEPASVEHTDGRLCTRGGCAALANRRRREPT